MVFHDIDSLFTFHELDGFNTIRFAARARFFILMRTLCGVLFGINLKYFTLLRGVSRAMHNACIFSACQRITFMTWIFCFAPVSVEFLGVGS